MAVDFSEVRVGDLVKLTRGEDEFVQVRVVQVATSPLHWVQDEQGSSYYSDEWNTLEIVKPPLPIKDGSVVRSEGSGTTFHLLYGRWISSLNRRPMPTNVLEKVPYQIVYVPED